MRARILDPQGPKAWRIAPYAAPFLALLFAIWGPIHGVAATMTGFAAIATFNLLGVVSRRQRKPRTAELVCGPGYVDVTKAGSRTQRIRARDIRGGTTARDEAGIALTLQHRKRQQPITVELQNDGDVEKVRLALGIGHGGFGVVAWQTQLDHSQRPAVVGRVLAAAWAILTMVATLAVSAGTGAVVGFSLGLFGVIGAFMGMAGLGSATREPNVVMAADGLRLRTPRGWFTLPYEALQRIDDGRVLSFAVPAPYTSVTVERSTPLVGGPSDDERRILIAQIRAAAQRARGMGPQKNDVTGRVEVLRRNGESPRDWLVRLDIAGQMLSAGPGYRGHALDTDDLWAILEDPEAEGELRAAAARVLRHSTASDTRVRIDAAVAAIRDESTNRRIRIAIHDDLDSASQELAYLEAEARHDGQTLAGPRAHATR